MQISVIIPTYNRAAILRQCLERLFRQEGVTFEVIVADDGSTDDTEAVALSFPGLKYLKLDHAQQGVARNRGAEVATGDILVFIGDDIFTKPDFLQKHAERHQHMSAENVVVLGFTTWDPAVEINDYMRFLETSGWQFGYGELVAGFADRPDAYKFFYTSNISLKRSFFQQEPFDESFRGYGWEDIEWGYRLVKNRGARLFLEPEARALHHQVVLEADLPAKMQAIARGAAHFQQLHPTVPILPRGLKRLLIRAATQRPFVWGSRFIGKDLYYKLRSWRELFRSQK